MHALILNGAVEKYPYSIGNLRKDNPQVSFPKNPPDETLAAFGMLPVTRTAPPEFDPLHERLQDGAAVNGDGVVQVWTVLRRDDIPTVEDFAAAQIARIKADCGDAILVRLPIHRQLNYQQRAIELLDIRRERGLTAEEAAERDFIMVERDWLNAMRVESNRLEAAIVAAVDSDATDDVKRTTIAALIFVAVP
jgi:hypothetical protein